VAGDVGEPEIASGVAIRKLLVVDAHQRQHRAMNSVDVHAVLGGVVADIVGRAVGEACLDAAARHPDAVTVGIVIAAVAAGKPECARIRRPRSPAYR
jgi:hypothetical protein